MQGHYPTWWGDGSDRPPLPTKEAPPKKQRPSPRLAYSKPAPVVERPVYEDDLVTARYLPVKSRVFSPAPHAAPMRAAGRSVSPPAHHHHADVIISATGEEEIAFVEGDVEDEGDRPSTAPEGGRRGRSPGRRSLSPRRSPRHSPRRSPGRVMAERDRLSAGDGRRADELTFGRDWLPEGKENYGSRPRSYTERVSPLGECLGQPSCLSCLKL